MKNKEELEKLIKEIESIRGKSIFDVDKLIELVKNQDYKENWYCSGRITEKEGYNVNYCIYAYQSFRKNNQSIDKCTADCKFYRALHEKWYNKLYRKIYKIVLNTLQTY